MLNNLAINENTIYDSDIDDKILELNWMGEILLLSYKSRLKKIVNCKQRNSTPFANYNCLRNKVFLFFIQKKILLVFF